MEKSTKAVTKTPLHRYLSTYVGITPTSYCLWCFFCRYLYETDPVLKDTALHLAITFNIQVQYCHFFKDTTISDAITGKIPEKWRITQNIVNNRTQKFSTFPANLLFLPLSSPLRKKYLSPPVAHQYVFLQSIDRIHFLRHRTQVHA